MVQAFEDHVVPLFPQTKHTLYLLLGCQIGTYVNVLHSLKTSICFQQQLLLATICPKQGVCCCTKGMYSQQACVLSGLFDMENSMLKIGLQCRL